MRNATAALALIVFLHPGKLYGACTDGTQPSGAKYRICLPDGTWNRQLLVYAHGYVPPDQPIAIPEDQLTLPDGTSLPGTFNSLGYAFAISSYRSNGLAILDGEDDLKELTAIFNTRFGKPDSTYLGGVSEGGLVATLSAEQFPGTYDAAISACGPIGSFSGQVNYIGDARLLFDYFFPGILPGNVIDVPTQLWVNWESVYVPAIRAALASSPANRQNFLNASLIPTATDPATTADNVIAALGYSAVATNDAKVKLRGQPYDNRYRIYYGTTNDFELNTHVMRYTADPAAVQSMKLYETTGKPQIPLVTLHTTADPVVPWTHEAGYFFKALQNNYRNLIQIPVFRNGHCNFEAGDILWAFIVMLAQSHGTTPASITKNFTNSQLQILPAEVRANLLHKLR